jgi:hypothetical protein
MSNFKIAINEIARLQAGNAKFAQYLQAKEDDEGLDLKTLLACPVNQLSQYEYHMQVYSEHVFEGTQEAADCAAAYSILQQSCRVVQSSLVESGENAKIMAIQRILKSDGPLSLMQPNRRLRSEFYTKKLRIFVFNDLVVLAKVSYHQYRNAS